MCTSEITQLIVINWCHKDNPAQITGLSIHPTTDDAKAYILDQSRRSRMQLQSGVRSKDAVPEGGWKDTTAILLGIPEASEMRAFYAGAFQGNERGVIWIECGNIEWLTKDKSGAIWPKTAIALNEPVRFGDKVVSLNAYRTQRRFG